MPSYTIHRKQKTRWQDIPASRPMPSQNDLSLCQGVREQWCCRHKSSEHFAQMFTHFTHARHTHAPIFVFMRGITRRYYKTVHVGPPAHGAVANRSTEPGPSHGEEEKSGEAEGTGTVGTPLLPALRVTTHPQRHLQRSHHRHIPQARANTHRHSSYIPKFTTK